MPRKAKPIHLPPVLNGRPVRRRPAEVRDVGREATGASRSAEQVRDALAKALGAAVVREDADRQQLRWLASQLSLAEERERRRIAVEIHDNLSQNLALIKMKLGMLRQRVDQPEALKGIDELSGLLDPVLERTRSLTFELSPPVLYELGLDEALEWLAERMAQQHHVVVCFEEAPKAARAAAPVPHDVAVLLFQAVRELLMNVVKHAAARHVTVRSARADGDVSITVSDDGRGFDVSDLTAAGRHGAGSGNGNGNADGNTVRNSGGDRDGKGNGDGDARAHDLQGFGLFSIRTRLEHLGGRMEIRSAPNAGTNITLAAPLAPTPGPPESPAGEASTEKFYRGLPVAIPRKQIEHRRASPPPVHGEGPASLPLRGGSSPSASRKRSKS
jgi:signal transduction histidine kinase